MVGCVCVCGWSSRILGNGGFKLHPFPRHRNKTTHLADLLDLLRAVVHRLVQPGQVEEAHPDHMGHTLVVELLEELGTDSHRLVDLAHAIPVEALAVAAHADDVVAACGRGRALG